MMRATTAQEFYSVMSGRYRELTGFEPEGASDIGIRLRVLAEELQHLDDELDRVCADAFPQTAGAQALELHAQCAGMFRRPARCAAGTLRFSRLSAGPRVQIPAGTVCVNAGGTMRFQTTEDGSIPNGDTEADIPAAALVAGEQGNIARDGICVLISAIPGVSAVRNPEPFSGGLETETDEQLRARLMEELCAPADSANRAYYNKLACGHAGVRSARILPRERGAGTLDVVIACREGFSGYEAAAELQNIFFEAREIGTDVLVRTAKSVPVDVSAMIVISDVDDEPEMTQRCLQAIRDHIGGLAIGEPLYIARVTECLMGVEGMVNVRVVAPKQDAAPAPDEVITAGVLAVGRVDSL